MFQTYLMDSLMTVPPPLIYVYLVFTLQEGFRTGLSVGQERELQTGFNEAFSGSIALLKKVSIVRGQIWYMLMYMLKVLCGHYLAITWY